jgi:hypothetical protein
MPSAISGLVVIPQLLSNIGPNERFRGCFRHLKATPILGHASIMLLLIVHMVLGYRELRHVRYYCDDPLVKLVLGSSRLPDVAISSRALAGAD